MTHRELVERACRWLVRSQGCGFALPEFVAYTNTNEIADAIGYYMGRTILVECKTSREDFRKDAVKPFRRIPALGMGDLRYYMVPPGVVTVQDLPEKWGLLYVHPRRVAIKKEAEWIGANLKSERGVFASVIRRAHLQGDLDKYLRMPDWREYRGAYEVINDEF